jgi:hypothetical protein
MTDNPFRPGLNDSPAFYRLPDSQGFVLAPYEPNRFGSANSLLQQHHIIPNNIFGSRSPLLVEFWQRLQNAGYDQRDPATNRAWTTTNAGEALRMNIPLHQSSHTTYDNAIRARIEEIARWADTRLIVPGTSSGDTILGSRPINGIPNRIAI